MQSILFSARRRSNSFYIGYGAFVEVMFPENEDGTIEMTAVLEFVTKER